MSHKVYTVYLASGKTDSRQLVVKNNILEMDNTWALITAWLNVSN